MRLNAWAFSADIVKEPNLTFAAPALMEHFGVSRAVFVIRHPHDNIRSILDRLKLPGNLSALDTSRVKANRTWRSLLAGHDLDLPPDHYVTTLARRWLRAVRIYESARDRFELFRYHESRVGLQRRHRASGAQARTRRQTRYRCDCGAPFPAHGHAVCTCRIFRR